MLITALQNRLTFWGRRRLTWAMKNNTSFIDHFNEDMYKRVLEAKKLKTNIK